MHQWCPAFYRHVFTRSFSTNNYVEGLNHALKCQLILRPNLRTDSLWKVVFDDFTPKYVRRHLAANLASADHTVSFTRRAFPPEFGRRPLRVLIALQDRCERSKDIPSSDIQQLGDGNFRFHKGKNVLRAEYELAQYQKRVADSDADTPPNANGQSATPPTTSLPTDGGATPTPDTPLSSTTTDGGGDDVPTSRTPSSAAATANDATAQEAAQAMLRELAADIIANPSKNTPLINVVLSSNGHHIPGGPAAQRSATSNVGRAPTPASSSGVHAK